jgi:hypothetical protein
MGGADGNHSLTMATRNLFQNLTRSAAPVPPMEFILSLRRAYPQFGQTSRWACGQCRPGWLVWRVAAFCWEGRPGAHPPRSHLSCLPCPGYLPCLAPCRREGYYMQQDADECWTNILASLRDKLKASAAQLASHPAPKELGLGLCRQPGCCRMLHAALWRCPTCIWPHVQTGCLPGCLPRLQGGPTSSDAVIRQLFGVKLHKSLKAEEGDETIEVRCPVPGEEERRRCCFLEGGPKKPWCA